jgi:hypothetical protein
MDKDVAAEAPRALDDEESSLEPEDGEDPTTSDEEFVAPDKEEDEDSLMDDEAEEDEMGTANFMAHLRVLLAKPTPPGKSPASWAVKCGEILGMAQELVSILDDMEEKALHWHCVHHDSDDTLMTKIYRLPQELFGKLPEVREDICREILSLVEKASNGKRIACGTKRRRL